MAKLDAGRRTEKELIDKRRRGAEKTGAGGIVSVAKATPTRERILISSAELFSRQGYSQPTIRTLAVAAGMPAGTLGHYFPTREDLMLDLVRRGAAIQIGIVRSITDLGAGMSAEDVFRTAIGAHLQALLEEPPFLDAFVQISLNLSDEHRLLVDAELVSHRLYMYELVRDIVDPLRFDDGEIHISMRCILGSLYTARHWRNTAPSLTETSRIATEISDISMFGLARGHIDPSGYDKPAWGTYRPQADPEPENQSKTTAELILDHAAAYLTEYGPSGLPMRKLAAAIDIRAPTIYYYYPSKDDLLLAVATRGVDDLFLALDRLADTDHLSPEARFAGAVIIYMRKIFSGANRLAAYMRIARDPPPDIADAIDALTLRVTSRFTSILRDVVGDDPRCKLAVDLLLGGIDYSRFWFEPKRVFGHSQEDLGNMFANWILVGVRPL